MTSSPIHGILEMTPAGESLVSIGLTDGRAVDAQWTEAGGPGDWVLVYAPGAGSNIDDGFGAFASRYFAGTGIATLRFQFPYMQDHKRFPDRMPVLESTWRGAIEVARKRHAGIAISGRSMGGRVASYIAAAGDPVDALVCFAYPLHPPGKPNALRDAHLKDIRVPMLVCSGDRDVFGAPDELRAALAAVPRAQLHLLEGADHSYKTLKSSGRTQADVWQEAAETTVKWLQAL